MMSWIGGAASKLKATRQSVSVEALARVLPSDWVDDAIRESGRESVRDGKLPAQVTAWVVILLGLFRRHSYENVLSKLRDSWIVAKRWSKGIPTSSALTQARDRLHVGPLRRLFERCVASWTGDGAGLIFYGRRVVGLDGSTAKVPDSEKNRDHFGLPSASRGRAGYPQLRWVSLLDVGTRIFTAVRFAPYVVGEKVLARQLLSSVRVGSLLLLDRGFAAYELLWDIVANRTSDFVVRLPKHMRFEILCSLGRGDALVRVQLPRQFRKQRPDMPRFWTLRLITYRPKGGSEDIRLLVSILDASSVPAEELAKLYHVRWDHEIGIDEFKTHLCGCATVNRPLLFRSKTPTRVAQEFYGLFIAHNAVRRIMVDAAGPAKADPLRLSYTDALIRLREAVREFTLLPTRRLRGAYRKLLQGIGAAKVLFRPGRKFPRAVKIKMSKFKVKQRLRAS